MIQIRSLRMAVLARHRRTGELLTAAKILRNIKFDDLIRQHDISEGHASLCMDLYVYWEEVIAAEAWSHDQGGIAPATPKEALGLVPPWKQAVKFH